MVNIVGILLLALAASFNAPDSAYSETEMNCKDSEIIKQLPDKAGNIYEVVDSIEPMSLIAKLENKDKKYIVNVIQVIDPVKLCHSIECVKLFVSRRENKLKEGMRAVFISELDSSCHISSTKLLWGSASVLVLQPDRIGSGLWKVVIRGGHQAFDLVTEGTHGTITKSKGSFKWHEYPDR